MSKDINDEETRRSYWIEQMEAAYKFMQDILEYPVDECGEPVVALQDVVRAEGLSVLFAGTKIAGKYDRIFCLRSGLIDAFIAACREMNERGWTLTVDDAFRSRDMQKNIALQENVFDIILQKVIWESRGVIPDRDLVFRRLSALSATAPKIGTHMSGTAMDISVISSDDHAEVDRGGAYIEFSELTPMDSPFVSETGRRNRAEISGVMLRHGFVAYPYEFWHYNQADAYSEYLMKSGEPARYGPVDVDLDSGKVTPIINPNDSLHSMDDIEQRIEEALRRSE